MNGNRIAAIGGCLVLVMYSGAFAQSPAAVGRLANGGKPELSWKPGFEKERDEYIINGKPVWKAEAVTLPGGSEIARGYSIVPVADLRVRVAVEPPAGEETASETWLTFAMGANGYGGIALVTKQEKGQKPEYLLNLVAVAPAEPDKLQIKVVRRATADVPHDGVWTVRYNFGVVTVLRDGVTVLTGDTGFKEFPVMGLRLRQASGRATLSELSLTALGPAAKLSQKQIARSNELMPKWQAAAGETGRLLGQRKWKEMAAAARTQFDFEKELFGEDSLTALSTLGLVGLAKTQLDDLEGAADAYQRAYDACRTKVGDDHTESARLLRDVGFTKSKQGKLSESSVALHRAAITLKNFLGDENSETIFTFKAAAFDLWKAERWADAAVAYETVLRMQGRVDKNGAEFAQAQKQYAYALRQLGRAADAEKQLRELVASVGRRAGPASHEAVEARSDLAAALRDFGRVVEARRMLEEIRAIDPKGDVDVEGDVIESAYSLAALAAARGDSQEAERLADDAERRSKKSFEKDLVGRALHLQRHASVLESLGEYAPALERLRESERLLEKAGPTARGLRRTAKVDLVSLEFRAGRIEEAERTALEALQMLSESEGYALSRATVLESLGVVKVSQRQFDEAEGRFTEAAKILEKLGPAGADLLPTCWILIAHCREARKDFARATELTDRALRHYRSVFGPKHQNVINGLYSKGTSLQLQGDWEAADALYREALDLEFELSSSLLGSLSEAEAVRLSSQLQRMRNDRMGLSRFVRIHGEEEVRKELKTWPRPDARKDYGTVWETKALATRLLGQRIQGSEAAPAELGRLAAVRAELGKIYLDPKPPSDGDARADRLAVLTAEKEKIERGLAEHGGDRSQEVDLRDADGLDRLAAALPEGSVVIDFVEIARRPNALTELVTGEKGETGSRSYDAWVLRPSGTPPKMSVEWVTLGDAESLDKEILELGRIQGARGLRLKEVNEARRNEAAVAVARRLWAPLAPHLKDVTSVYVVPDGKLHLVSWGGLPDPAEPDHFLVEKHSFVTAAYAQQWLAPSRNDGQEPHRLLLVGDVDFGKVDGKGAGWRPLPGTKAEVDQIRSLAPEGVQVVRREGVEATSEAVLAAAPDARWIHLATHGFFYPATSRDRLDDPHLRASGMLRASQERNPLFRCGLVFAGANTVDSSPSPSFRPVLTGEDVLNGRLSGAELVVLSACETNVGVDTGGEGIFALQRAFHMAGARSVLSTLWKVDDDATAAFMGEFYRLLWKEKRSKSEALREAQRALLERYDLDTHQLVPSEPAPREGKAVRQKLPAAYWAAFVLSGDWR